MTRARDLADGIFEQATGGVLKLETSDTTVTDGSVLGKIEFKAPDEASGTDAILVGAAIEAVAEGTFAADNNATELVFKTGASAAADRKMTLTSGGDLLVGGTTTNHQDGSSQEQFSYINGAFLAVSRSGATVAYFNRQSNDGEIAAFRKDGNTVGSISITNSASVVSLTGTSSGGGIAMGKSAANVYPARPAGVIDNTLDFGSSSYRWDDIFATNGTIQTSDRNEKQDITALTSAEMLVAKRISALFKTFRWKDKVAAKGDNARTHSGIIAQDVQAAFTAEGLDAGDYSLFISSTWWEHDVDVAAVEADDTVDPAIEAADAYTHTNTYNTEDEAPSGSISKTRLGIRYPELLSFLAAYNEQRFAAIETRLTALEG